MHVLAPNQAIEKYPYSIGNLRRDNPQTSFPRDPSEALLAVYHVYPVRRTERPEINSLRQDLTEDTPVRQKARSADGTFRSDDPATPQNEAWEWVQVWVVTDVSPEEVERRLEEQREQVRQQRGDAYRQDADPLFFQAQRGAATMDEWEAKVQEIRDRFPYPAIE